jgi:hypothetical protein
MIRRKPRKYNTAIRRYVRKHRMYSNPSLAGMMNVMKQVAPAALAFYVGRIIANKVTAIPAVGAQIAKLGTHAAPALAAATFVGGSFAAAKIKPLAKYSAAIMTGLGLNLVFTLVDAYVPDSLKTTIGLGDDQLYDEALADYENVGEYQSGVEGYENVEGLGSIGGGMLGDGSGEGVPGGGIFAQTGWGA